MYLLLVLILTVPGFRRRGALAGIGPELDVAFLQCIQGPVPPLHNKRQCQSVKLSNKGGKRKAAWPE